MGLKSHQSSAQNFSKLAQGGLMPRVVSNLYQFDEFRLDAQKRVLLRRQEPVALTPKSFETLLVLVQNGGRLLTKNELMQAVWPDRFVDESNLTQTIFVLRKALGESRSGQRFIMTTPGRGYHFAADVEQVKANGQLGAESAAIGPHSEVRSSVKKATIRPWPVLFAFVIVLSAALGAYFQWFRSRSQPQLPVGRLMLAVLPFENLTGDAGQEYFSDGLTEEMITQLGRLDPQHLGVIARTSVMHYKHSQEQLSRVGAELGVHYVLEGSVRRDSGKVRITAQLIQT